MFLKVALVLLVVVGGALLGFLVEMAGCAGREPLFGVMCGHNAPLVVGPLTILFWIILGGLVIFGRRGGTDR